MSRTWNSSPSTLVLTLLTAFAVGLLVAGLSFPALAPSSIAPTASALTARATEIKTVDAHDATLTISTAESQNLESGMSGAVTSTRCIPGGSAESGNSLISVNDSSLILLGSSRPLWRDLSVGDKGEDVRSLQTELARIGYPTQVDGNFGNATLKAAITLAMRAGATDATTWTQFPASRFVWTPAAVVQTVSCDARVGSRIDEGDSLATLPAAIVAAKIAPLPETSMAGQRVIAAGDLVLHIDNGSIDSQEALRQLTQSSVYRDHLDKIAAAAAGATESKGPSTAGDGLAITYQLANETVVFSVPAAAVYNTTGTGACVVADGKPMRVTIAGSQLGQTFVIPPAGAKPQTVKLNTREAESCR